MKKAVLNGCMSIIQKNNNYDEKKLSIIKYGIEALYLSITKMIIVITLSIFLGITKEVILLLFCYNLIRNFSFGLHATKSIYCLTSSLLLFIGGVYVCNYVNISIYIKAWLCLVCLISLYKYAPADTYKKPIVNAKRRKTLKIKSLIVGGIYSIIILIFPENMISNYLLLGMIEAVILINPTVYKIFNLPFDNYKNYKFQNQA